jgi:hypothetical protein
MRLILCQHSGSSGIVGCSQYERSAAWLSIQYVVQALGQFAKPGCDVAIEYARSPIKPR